MSLDQKNHLFGNLPSSFRHYKVAAIKEEKGDQIREARRRDLHSAAASWSQNVCGDKLEENTFQQDSMTVCSGFKSNKIRRSKHVKKLEMAALISKCGGTLKTVTTRLQQPDRDVSQQDHNQSPQSLNFALWDEKCYNIPQQWSKVHLSIMMLLPASCSQIVKRKNTSAHKN